MKADYKANHRFKIKKRVTYHKLLFSFCGAYRTRTDHLDTASVEMTLKINDLSYFV